MHPESLLDAVKYFSDLRVCNAYMRKIKWPGGLTCHHRRIVRRRSKAGARENGHSRILDGINKLRAEEGASVTIMCDNPEGPPNCAVEVCDDWTNYEGRRFEGKGELP